MGLGQRSFDDLGTPLADVTFCVIDLETTGGTADDGGITEFGAVKLRGGACLGTFQTLVNPGRPLPPFITVLTGITEAMLYPAPRVEEVLPALLEFIGDAVIVGHNVRYDLGYLRAAVERGGYPPITNPSVDTVALARRLVRDEVPNCKLGTLADRLRLPHRPSHRALDDALATGDLLHYLLERASGLGVLGLDDLLDLPRIAGHPQVAKLRLTDGLPRRPGVYLFRDVGGRALYVGKATNLRTRVRSYFSGDERRKVGSLLREVQRIDHIECASPLEAAVLEVRLIHQLEPRFNRQLKTWRSYAYLKLTNERFPRLSVVRAVRPDGALYLGPLPSSRFAQRVAEAIETVVPLRRCKARPGPARREAPCAPAQLGVATCPCSGATSEAEYQLIVDRLRHGLLVDPSILLDPLHSRMQELAATERFEEAADVRDRAAALSHALRRQRRLDGLRRADHVVLELPGSGGGAELRGGRLVRAWSGRTRSASTDENGATQGRLALVDAARPLPSGRLGLALSVDDPEPGAGASAAADAPVARDLADELACVAAWLDKEAHHLRLVHCDGGLASPFPPIPSFEPAPGPRSRR